jgi:hypothetical protein
VGCVVVAKKEAVALGDLGEPDAIVHGCVDEGVQEECVSAVEEHA